MLKEIWCSGLIQVGREGVWIGILGEAERGRNVAGKERDLTAQVFSHLLRTWEARM